MTADEDIRYMKEALNEAMKALAADEIPIGAVVVADGRIIGRGHNLTETLHDVTAHAEMLAITAATEALGAKYLDQCTLYVTVEPCVMCAGAMGWAQIKNVVYGAPEPRRGFRTYAPEALHPRCNCRGGVMEEDCKKLMIEFFKKRR